MITVENENHCDFVKLREMLIRTNMQDMIDTTHYKHYELYRCNKMKDMGFTDNDNMRYVLTLCVCVCVFYVTYNKGMGSGFCDVYNSYRIMTKRLLPKYNFFIYISTYITQL